MTDQNADQNIAPPPRSFKLKLLVAVAIFVFLLICSVAADRITGRIVNRGASDGIVFPPHSTFRYQTPEFDFTAHINRLGFRDREFAAEKTARTRIIAVGDSFTYGWGVGIDETWAKIVETKLRAAGADVEIADLGQPGGSPADYARIAAKAAPILKPDLIIVGVLQGDDLGAYKYLKQTADTPPDAPPPPNSLISLARLGGLGRRVYPNFIQMASNLFPAPPVSAVWKNQVTEGIAKFNAEERARFEHLDGGIKQAVLNGELNPALVGGAIQHPNYFLDTYDVENPETRSLIAKMADDLAQIKHTADQAGSRVLVVSIPYKVYASRRDLESSRKLGLNLIPEMAESGAADKATEIACQTAGIEFFEATHEFRKTANQTELFYAMDGHFNAAGHQTFADLLAPFLLERLKSADRK